jgi:hypothetical protein
VLSLLALLVQKYKYLRCCAPPVSQSKTAADATAAFLSNQLDRLDRLLSDNSNARRVGRVQSQAQAEAYMMRMDRYRAGPANIDFFFLDFFFFWRAWLNHRDADGPIPRRSLDITCRES